MAGPLPLSFAALAEIEIFYFDNTRLCVTADEALGAWLDAIPYHIGTGAGCAERVANHPSNDVRPTTSADRRIAFNSDRDGNWEIYSMRANGTGVTRLTDHREVDSYPAWSPDGRRIAFVSDRDGDKDVYVMNANGTGVTRLTNHPADDSHPAWYTPDGRVIVFHSSRDGDY